MRLIDRMCPIHVKAVSTRWSDTKDCVPCDQRSAGMACPQLLPDLTPDEHDYANAVHEAGHAVAMLVARVRVGSVRVWRAGENNEPGDGGYTAFEDEDPPAQMMDRFTILWAGQEAADRWLTLLGHGTEANRVDLRCMARHDADKYDTLIAQEVAVADQTVAQVRGLAEARVVVDTYWPQIVTVADALVRRRLLSGRDLWELLDAKFLT